MHITFKVFIAIFFAAGFSFAQQKDSALVNDTTKSYSRPDSTFINKSVSDSLSALDSLSLMKKKFDQFKYGDVISIANRLLLRKGPFVKKDILNIYKMQGIAHYSLSEDDAAQKSFIEILRIDSTYKLDSTSISPKIISFYRQVKNDYFTRQKEIEAHTVVRIDTVYVPKIEYDVEYENILKGAVARSIFIPGLGQLYLQEYFKGTVLTLLSSIALVSSVYYIIDTNKKEKAYLVETNTSLIESKYNDYNSSYKNRNISLISFGILWIYSQLDLLIFSDHQTSGNGLLKDTSLKYDGFKGISLNIRYSF